MKSTLKNIFFMLRRFRFSGIINILGFTIAFAVFLVVAIQCYYDLNFNHYFKNRHRIEQANIFYAHDNRSFENFNTFIPEDLKEQISEIETYALRSTMELIPFSSDIESKKDAVNINLYGVNRGFLEVFTPKLVQGNFDGLFEDPDKVLISESEATKLFADESAIGKTIFAQNSKASYTIAAVYKDFPQNSSIENGIFVKHEETAANNHNFYLYLLIQENTRDIVLNKMNNTMWMGEDEYKYLQEHPELSVELQLRSFNGINMLESKNQDRMITLIILGLITLVTAYINFLNLSVAMIPSRVKGINIQKILGINKYSLKLSIVSEGVVFVLISFILSLFIVRWFAVSSFTQFFSADLSLGSNIMSLILSFFLFICIVVFIGIYPAKFLSSIPETLALKGSFALSPKGVQFRNLLLAIQFTAVIAICSIALFMKEQHNYMKNFSLGIEKENIVYLPLQGLKTNHKTFGEEICKESGVLEYTASQFVPGYIGMNWGRIFEDKAISVHSWPVIPGFLEFFGAKVIAGATFMEEADIEGAPEQVIVNQKFLDKYDFDYNLVGKAFKAYSPGIIQGVAADVNFQSLRNPIEPMVFVVLNSAYREQNLNYIFLKLSGDNMVQTLDNMKMVWNKFSDEPFKPVFLEDTLNKLYQKESSLGIFISLVGIIVILISLMGVYGLIVFNTFYKTKEIALRKVNGASRWQIVALLNKNIMLIFSISFLISIPIAYYAIVKWLENFAYKSPIPVWIFIVSALLVLLISGVTVIWRSWRAASINPAETLKSE